ncbi:MAG: hypothetical protein OWR52_03100 [Acidibacillus sp.]|nr:hypothetical protein [Acidibacillus sp.]
MPPNKPEPTKEDIQNLTLWADWMMPVGQWVITVGAAMVAAGLTVNYYIARRKIAKERITDSNSGKRPL